MMETAGGCCKLKNHIYMTHGIVDPILPMHLELCSKQIFCLIKQMSFSERIRLKHETLQGYFSSHSG